MIRNLLAVDLTPAANWQATISPKQGVVSVFRHNHAKGFCPTKLLTEGVLLTKFVLIYNFPFSMFSYFIITDSRSGVYCGIGVLVAGEN